jgi:putative protease
MNPEEAEDSLREQLARFGNTDFELGNFPSVRAEPVEVPLASTAPPHSPFDITSDLAALSPSRMASSSTKLRANGSGLAVHPSVTINWTQPWFVPNSLANKLRREAVEKLEAARLKACTRLLRKAAAEPPAKYPEETLSFLANVYNSAARAFYAKHGVKLIEAAYEAHEEAGEVSLMITRHCIRYSLSLCPKQAKGVIGVQGQVRAEPMTLINGSEHLTLQFDCKACEMHVMGKMKKHILKTPPPSAVPVTFHPPR